MSYVAYNSNKIIPAPQVTITREYSRSGDGSRIGQRLIISLAGKFVAQKGGLYTGSGYPADNTSIAKFQDLLNKQENLKNLFSNTDYAWLEIKPDPEATSTALKWIAKVDSIDFPQGNWTQTCDYVVKLSAQVGDAITDYDVINDYSETWELQYLEDPEGTYNLSHSVRCGSREQYVVALAAIKEGWKKAYDYVNNKLGGAGVDNTIVQADPGFALSAGFLAYNHILNKSIDEVAGIYAINESWRMSKTPYAEDQQIEVRTDRDVPEGHPSVSVSVSGSITGYRTEDGTGFDAAQARWATVEPTLLAAATSASNTTLKTTPKSKSVNIHSKTRQITYSYTYDDGSENAYNDMTVDVSNTDQDCNKTSVRISGTITGIKSDTATAYQNALAMWDTFKDTIYAEASTAYGQAGGVKTLRTAPTDKSIGLGEQQGRVTYAYTFNDWETAYVHEQTIATTYRKKDDRGTVVVAGNIKAWCADGYDSAKTYWETLKGELYDVVNPLYSGTKTLSSSASSSQSTHDVKNRSISYSYEFDDFNPAADVEITYSVEEGQDNCGHKRVRMDGAISGKTHDGTPAWENAKLAFASYANPQPSYVDDYISGGRILSKSVSYNEFNNRINFSYTFTDEPDNYVVDETISSETDPNDCGYLRITQTGNITGVCTGVAGSALTNAEIGLTNLSTPAGAVTRIRSVISKSERRGTISYTYEYTNRSEPYTWDESITERESIDQKGKSQSISGTITGLCSGDAASTTKYSNALIGWAAHQPATPSGFKQISSSITKNQRQGIIQYQYEYRQLSSCISGAIEENISITEEFPSDIFAVVGILGGPSIIQDKNSTTVARKTVQVDVRLTPNASCALTGKPDVSSIIASAKPVADIVVTEKDADQWMPWTGRYSRTTSWVYMNC